jgi:hypothetical protein
MSTQASVIADSAATLTITADTVFFALPGITSGTGAANSVQVLASDMKTFFQGGTASEFVSTTAIATPSAFVATTFAGFASTVSGATLMGFGTANDVTLKNRAGTTVLGVTANTTGVTMAGALAITGALSGVTTLAASSTVTLTAAAANTASLVSTGYSLTGSDATSMVSYTGTLNTSGNPVVFKLAITDTSSGTTTNLMELLAGAAGATTRFRVRTSGATTITAATNTAPLTLTAGSVTGAATSSLLVATQTWNTSGAPTAFSVAVTNTASDAASKLFDFLAGAAGATSLLSLTVTGASTGLLTVDGSGYGAGVASVRLNGLTTAAVTNQTGTLLNAPSAGNPVFWIPVNIAGTVRYVPAWA